MQNHTKIYFKESGIDPFGFVPCETCGAEAVDTGHLEARGMGGNPSGDKDVFENLIATCRKCHIDFHDKKQYKSYLKRIHAGTFPHLLRYDEETEEIICLY